jgi:ATP-dependent Lon protease
VEATGIPGRGKLILTGQLGDVMKESAQAALTLVKSRAAEFGIDADLQKSDVHVHVPAGAIPKDGPSAGVAIFLALTSLLTGRTIRSDTAMTGEISLRGLVLPIGGVKEKVLAAIQAGITTVMLPARNRRDIEDVPEKARNLIRFVFLERVDDAIDTALNPPDTREPEMARRQHGIVHELLEIGRQHRQCRQQHDADDKNQDDADHEIPVAEQRGIDERVARRHSVDRKEVEAEHAERDFDLDLV